jgi:Holliday junction resolvase RusA-like endonuclease
MKIIVEGNPLPLQRARAGKSGFYDPQFIAKRNFAHIVQEQYKDPPITTAISLTVTFNMQMPKSWSKKKKVLMNGQPHLDKKDIDNLAKYVLDALNSVVWEDDCLISEIHAEKIWAEKGSTIIEIGEIK